MTNLPVTFFGSLPNYCHHLVPIFHAMPHDRRLEWFLGTEATRDTLIDQMKPDEWRQARVPDTYPVVVGGFVDYQRVGGGRWVCMVEHGVGQGYSDRNPSNPGGEDRHGVHLYLCPNQRVADLNKAAYPAAEVEVVGSPWLDTLQLAALHGPKSTSSRPTIGLTWHWNNPQSPESQSAWRYYREILPQVAKEFDILGTAHPRWYNHSIAAQYDLLGIPHTPNFEDVVRMCDLLVLDNSSAGVEYAAATGRPVVWLNAPTYRLEAAHGGRFWDWIGHQVQVDTPQDLIPAIYRALGDPPGAQESRQAMVASCFAHTDGHAAERAVKAILQYAP